MKFSQLIAKSARMISREDAEFYVGGAHMLQLMLDDKWIKPSVRKHRLTLFDVNLLDQACDRLTRGEFPEPQTAGASTL